MSAVLLLLVLGLLAWPPSLNHRRPGGSEGGGACGRAVGGRVRSGRVAPEGASVGAAADAVLLLALALRSGRGVVESLDLVADISPGRVGDDLRRVSAGLQWGLEDHAAWAAVGPDWHPAAISWLAAGRAGVAPAGLLVQASTRMHEREEEAIAGRIQRAAVLLVLPLGGLFLPGFIATTVVPLVSQLLQRAPL